MGTTNGNVEVDQAAKEKAKLADLVTGKIEPMKKEQSTRKQVDQLKKQLAAFVSDSSLLSNLNFPLTKAPEDRTEFDAMVLQNLHESIAEREKELDEILRDGEPAKAAREAALTAASAKFEAVDARAREAKAALKAAEEAFARSEEGLGSARDALHRFPAEMEQVASQLTKATDDLTSFREGPLAAFECLLGRTALPAVTEGLIRRRVERSGRRTPALLKLCGTSGGGRRKKVSVPRCRYRSWLHF